jgi:hypothetical protein
MNTDCLIESSQKNQLATLLIANKRSHTANSTERIQNAKELGNARG